MNFLSNKYNKRIKHQLLTISQLVADAKYSLCRHE
jgi:hypothetical protein